MATSELGWERVRDLGLLALALVTCVLAYQAFRGFIFEDAYITYRYAENVAGGRGFVFNPGEHVLGTTTPLYTLLLAALALVGVDVPAAGTALSVASIAGVALAGAWILRGRSHPELGVLFAVLVLWGGFATYYLSGMETGFFSLLLLGAAIAVSGRRFVWTGVLLGLAFLTRYDAVVFAAPLLVFAALSERERDAAGGWRTALRGPLTATLVAAALALPWLVFATLYFGSPLPNTLAAKQGLLAPGRFLTESAKMFPRHLLPPLTSTRDLGISGLDAGVTLFLLAAIPFRLVALARAGKGALVFLAYPLLLWLAYASIGTSLCLWHMVPAFFSVTLLALLAWGDALSRIGGGERVAWAASLVLLLASFVCLPGSLRLQSRFMPTTESYLKREVGYEEMAAWMRARGLLDLVVCMDEPGYFTHLTGCRVVDRQGLVTRGVRPGDDLAALVEEHGVQVLFARESVPGFRRVCEVPRSLSVRADVVRERLAGLARPWLGPAPPDDATMTEAAEPNWDFEPCAEHGWHGAYAFVERPVALRYGGEPVTDAVLTTNHGVTEQRACQLLSPAFRIEFDELAFRVGMGGGETRRTLCVQLLINDLPVLEQSPGAAVGEMSEVRWPVHAWRGMRARLRVLDLSRSGWVVLDRVRALHERHARVLDDFEEARFGPLWTTTFAAGPVPYARTADALGLEFLLGRATASSLDVSGAVRLTSRPFVVDHDELAFVVQGFARAETRVELSVDGEIVRSFVPSGANALHAVVFDLTPFRGREAVLAAYDDDPDPSQGIGLDALCLFDRAE